MAAVGMWARSELRRGWVGTLALVVVVGVSAAVAMTAVAGARRTDTAYDRFRDAVAAPTHRLQYSAPDPGIDDEVAARLRSHPAVELAVPLWFTVAFSDATEHDLGVVNSSDPALLRDMDRPRLLSGRLPAPEATDEVVINEFLSADAALQAGDSLQLITFTQAQLEEQRFDEEPAGPRIEVTVVGIGRLPDDLADDEAPLVLASQAYHERYDGAAGAFGPSFELRLRDGADGDAVIAEVLDGLPVDEPVLEHAEAQSGRVRDATRVLVTGLLLFAACAALAGIVAAGQAITRRLAALATDQLTLAGTGLDRSWRIAGVLLVAAPIVVGGAGLGVVLAVAASPLMPIGIARRAEPSPGIDVDLPVLALGFAATLAVLAVVVLLAAWRITALGPKGASAAAAGAPLRPSLTAGAARRAGRSPSAVLGISMALEPGRGRTAVPVRPALVGGVVGVAGVVAALTFGASLDRLVSTPAAYGWNWSISPDLFEDDADTLAALPEVRDVGVLLIRETSVEGRPAAGMAVQVVAGSPSLTVLDGHMPSSSGEVALGPKTADELDKHVGDTVRVDTSDGQVVEAMVVGEVLFPVFDQNPFNEGLAFHPDLAGDIELSDGFGAAMVGFRPGVSEAEGVAAVRGVLPDALTVYSFPAQPGDVANLAQVRGVPMALAVFLVVVAAAAVGHALVTSVRRRRRDLGVVRSLGFRRRDVFVSVAVQATTIAAIGLVVGVPLGAALGRSAWSVVAGRLGVAPDPIVPLVAVAVLVPAGLAAAVLLAWLPGRAATRVSPAVALRAE